MKNKNQIKKDRRSVIAKAEQILLKLLEKPDIDQKAYDKAVSLYRKGNRKKARKHAQKFGYSGGLNCNIQSFQQIEDLLYDKHPQYYLIPN